MLTGTAVGGVLPKEGEILRRGDLRPMKASWLGSHRNDRKRRTMFESSRKKTGGHRCPVAASVAQTTTLETGGKKSGHEKGLGEAGHRTQRQG